MGFQKFVDIKCRLSGLRPSAAVIVATIRALKMHAGVGNVVAGKPLDPALLVEDPEAVRRGAENLLQHLAIVANYNIPAVVAINTFPIRPRIGVRGRPAGGPGGRALPTSSWRATSLMAALVPRIWPGRCGRRLSTGAPDFDFLSPDGTPLRQQIEAIATRVYGADGVDFSAQAEACDRCRSTDSATAMCRCAWPRPRLRSAMIHPLKGRPTGYRLPIRDARLFAGAGFVTAYCGDMRTMPGLPTRPGGEDVDIDAQGRIVGLF